MNIAQLCLLAGVRVDARLPLSPALARRTTP